MSKGCGRECEGDKLMEMGILERENTGGRCAELKPEGLGEGRGGGLEGA